MICELLRIIISSSPISEYMRNLIGLQVMHQFHDGEKLTQRIMLARFFNFIFIVVTEHNNPLLSEHSARFQNRLSVSIAFGIDIRHSGEIPRQIHHSHVQVGRVV